MLKKIKEIWGIPDQVEKIPAIFQQVNQSISLLNTYCLSFEQRIVDIESQLFSLDLLEKRVADLENKQR